MVRGGQANGTAHEMDALNPATTRPARPRLLGISTAVPPHMLRQTDVRALAERLFGDSFGDLDRLLPVFNNAGIEKRYSCVPLEWYDRDHSWSDRNRLYIDNAIELLAEAGRGALAAAATDPAEIDAIVTVSTTGIATPSLDAHLLDRLGLRPNVQRLPIFGLGCAGGVLGLGRAGEIAAAAPGRRVLFLVVELCGLTFRRGDRSKSNFVATALFGDGAAGVVLAGPGADGSRHERELSGWGEHTWPNSLDVMGWSVEDDGLAVIFSRDIPAIVRARLAEATDSFLDDQALKRGDIDHYICHPGGAKVLDAIEDVYGLQRGSLTLSREVLRDYGNMSAATVLFVLERALAAGRRGRLLLNTLGPGFTVGFATIEA
jgi:alkylresorcinol/alkylpyrone synthase